MKFLVTGRLIDQPVVPPETELALLMASFTMFDQGSDRRILAAHPFADTRATALFVEVESAEDLTELLGSIPASRVSTWEAHPLTTPAAILRVFAGWEKSAGA